MKFLLSLRQQRFLSRRFIQNDSMHLSIALFQSIDVNLQSALCHAAIHCSDIEKHATVTKCIKSSLPSNQLLQLLSDNVSTIKCVYQFMKFRSHYQLRNPMVAKWTVMNDVCAALLVYYKGYKSELTFKSFGVCKKFLRRGKEGHILCSAVRFAFWWWGFRARMEEVVEVAR